MAQRDVFAAIVDPANWTFGEGSAAGLMRDMADPGNPLARNRGPDRMSGLMNFIAPHINAFPSPESDARSSPRSTSPP